MAKKKAAAKKVIFKTRKSREAPAGSDDTIVPPEDIARAIDAFRDAQEQMKHFEGEMTVHKNSVSDYSLREFAKRAMRGKGKSFKVLGEQSMVTYVVMDASAGLTDEDLEAFRERWGDKAAEDLIVNDYASIRFNGEVLEANYEAFEAALQTLPADVLENLFKPMLRKARPGAVERAKKYAKTPEELMELLQFLKVRNYIR